MFYTNTPCKAHFSSRNCTIAIELLLLLTIFGTIAIAIAKDTSRLLLLVLLLLKDLSDLLLLIAIFTIGQLWCTQIYKSKKCGDEYSIGGGGGYILVFVDMS